MWNKNKIINKNSQTKIKQVKKKKKTTKQLSIIYFPSKYKSSQTHYPLLLRIARGNHQGSEGAVGGKALLCSEKSALKAATFVSSSSVGSAPVVGSIAAIGSIGISLVGKSLVARVAASTWGCFDVPTLGSTGFLCADLCQRKVAPIVVVIWTYSKGEKFSNSK